jgi:hypothetical protein
VYEAITDAAGTQALVDDGSMPNCWGEGQLLAFSGLDGPTHWPQALVLSTGQQPGSFHLRRPLEAELHLTCSTPLTFDCILGDVVTARSPQGRLVLTFADALTLIGERPVGAVLELNGRVIEDEPVRVGLHEGMGLWATASAGRWVVAVGDPGEQPPARLITGLRLNIDEVAGRQAALVSNLPVAADLPVAWRQLLRKAVSVMKVNCESPAGLIGRRWTTPDRWPHQRMWLWDSAFHAVGWARVDPAMAQDAVVAMIEQIDAEGQIPFMVGPEQASMHCIQPPLLAWALLEVLERTDDTACAAECLPRLVRHLNWIRANRDLNGNDVPEWWLDEHVFCRCGESGMDNSPRFDDGVVRDSVDLGSYLANDYHCAGRIARRLGQSSLADTLCGIGTRIGQATADHLWSASTGFFCDRASDGRFSTVQAVSGFMPLFAGIASRRQARALARRLADPSTFGTPVAIPSVALSDGAFSKDMWRGPMWPNINYLVDQGLRRYGFVELADSIRRQMLDNMAHWYRQEGGLFEYYDSLGQTSPRQLDRKQRLIRGEGIAPVCDYHWSAAVVAAMLAGDAQVIAPCEA